MAPAGRMRKSLMPSDVMSKPPTMFANALRQAGDSRFPWSASPKVDRLGASTPHGFHRLGAGSQISFRRSLSGGSASDVSL